MDVAQNVSEVLFLDAQVFAGFAQVVGLILDLLFVLRDFVQVGADLLRPLGGMPHSQFALRIRHGAAIRGSRAHRW